VTLPPEPPVTVKPPDVKERSVVEAVHTLKDDLQEVVREQKISVVRAVALEQGKKHDPVLKETALPRSVRSHPHAGMIFASALFSLLGIAALFGVYLVAGQRSGTVEPPANESIVFAEQTVSYQVAAQNPQTIKKELELGRSTSGTLGSIIRVIPIKEEAGLSRPLTVSEFMSAIGANPPSDLLRSLSGEFFFGFHTVDENVPVFVIPVTSYDHAFDAMLRWEKTLNADLAPIVTGVPRLVIGADGIPTERAFADRIFRNFDVRALSDDQGTIQLYYAFPTRNLLIIAESPYTFTEVVSRLQAARRM
jgi:hypothetical protein